MKIKRCLIAALALLCLCGCNSTGESSDSTVSTEETAVVTESAADETTVSDDGGAAAEDSSSSNLKDVFTKISETVELPDMVELNDTLITRYYGLSTDAAADYAGGVDSSGVGQDEIAIFKAADELAKLHSGPLLRL